MCHLAAPCCAWPRLIIEIEALSNNCCGAMHLIVRAFTFLVAGWPHHEVVKETGPLAVQVAFALQESLCGTNQGR